MSEEKVQSLEEEVKGNIILVPQLGYNHTPKNVPKSWCRRSKFLSTCISEDKEVEEILLKIDEENLSYILKYLEYFDDKTPEPIEKPVTSSDMLKITSRWEANFVNSFSNTTLLHLIEYVNYLAIDCLLDLTCAKLATLLRDKTTEEIRVAFSITNDFTPQEEQDALQELTNCTEY